MKRDIQKDLLEPVINSPEDELNNIYKARIESFEEIGNFSRIKQYEDARDIATLYLKKVIEQEDSHVG